VRLEPHPDRREPPILVTGSGRCGTGRLAAVLNACGLNVGHEGWWTLAERHYGLDADVSWLGCFDDGYPGRVLAQVRDPEACIPSIYANEHAHQYHVVRAQNVRLTGDWVVDACRIWVDYTRHAVERAEDWWRVEDVRAKDIAAAFDLAADDVERAMAATGHVNARPAAEFAWPDHEVTDEVNALAAELGYA
jgi:hypothetical protein